jgi:Fe-S-cluster containining protein
MNNMNINLRSFRKKVSVHKRSFRRFLTRLEKKTPAGLDKLVEKTEKEVWREVDCLSCANCCKTMTPTYTGKDIKRIASHLEMTADAFKKKWLRKEKSTGDWLNKNTPCQFLNPEDNKCSIYEVRPADCSGFPHLPKKRMKDYIHIHKQNVEFCPATFKMVEKIKEKLLVSKA